MSDVDVIEEKLSVVNHRIADLEAASGKRGERLGMLERNSGEIMKDLVYIKERLNSVEDTAKATHELTISINNLVMRMNGMEKDVNKLATILENQTARPQMWLDKVLWAIVGGGIAAVVAMIMSKFL